MARLAVEDVPVDSLVPYPGNPRRGDVNRIADSLRAHGQIRPVVVQASTRYVVAGNHLLEAAKLLEWPTVSATILDVDDDQARRILLVDNRTAQAGYDDKDDLARLLVELNGDLTATGFDEKEVDRLVARLPAVTLPGEDAPPAEPEPERIAHGQIQLVFDDPSQRTVWNRFNRYLRSEFPSEATATARLIAYIRSRHPDEETPT